jgi:hypothetical protein
VIQPCSNYISFLFNNRRSLRLLRPQLHTHPFADRKHKSDIGFETSMFSSVGARDGVRTRTRSMTRIIQRAEIRQVSPSSAAEAQTQPTLLSQKRDETLSWGPFPATPSPTGLPTGSPFSSPAVSSSTLPRAGSQASSSEPVDDSWDASCVIKSTVTAAVGRWTTSRLW